LLLAIATPSKFLLVSNLAYPVVIPVCRAAARPGSITSEADRSGPPVIHPSFHRLGLWVPDKRFALSGLTTG
jgi:hypothetical protein